MAVGFTSRNVVNSAVTDTIESRDSAYAVVFVKQLNDCYRFVIRETCLSSENSTIQLLIAFARRQSLRFALPAFFVRHRLEIFTSSPDIVDVGTDSVAAQTLDKAVHRFQN